jgi:hypothetical protein
MKVLLCVPVVRHPRREGGRAALTVKSQDPLDRFGSKHCALAAATTRLAQ